MIDKQDQADSLDVVLGDGSPAPPGRSIFDAWPEPPAPEWQPPTDEQHAHMQAAIGDVYARWADGISENPPEPQGASEFGAEGEYPAFSYLFDADPEKRDALRDEVLNVVRSDAGGA